METSTLRELWIDTGELLGLLVIIFLILVLWQHLFKPMVNRKSGDEL